MISSLLGIGFSQTWFAATGKTPDEAVQTLELLRPKLHELEKEGFLYAVPAKGFFVAPKNTELLREENLKKIEAHLTEAVRLSASCGLSREELREMLELLWEG